MKFYSHKIYTQHLEDMKSFKDSDEVRQQFIDWPKVIAQKFDRSYPRIGVLDLNDLTMEGYHAFYSAWNNLNWKLIMSKHPEERIAMITHYLKRRIKSRIVRAIARDRDTIRIPDNYYSTEWNTGKSGVYKYQTDIFLTRTFSSFFDPDVLDKADDLNNYVADQLNEMLNDFMDRLLNPLEKTIVKMSYGLDEEWDKSASQNRIAEYCNKTTSNVKVIKHRAINKLKKNKELIEKIYQNIVTN